jgi:hypothetical protein
MAQQGQGPASQPEGSNGSPGRDGAGGLSRRRMPGRQLDPPDRATPEREAVPDVAGHVVRDVVGQVGGQVGGDVVYRPWATYATVREAACRWLTKLRCEPDVAEDLSAGVAEDITRQLEKNPNLQAADAHQLDRYAFVTARRRLKRTRVWEDAHDEWNEQYRASSERDGSEAERPDVMFERRELAEVIVRGTQALVGQQQAYFVCEYELGSHARKSPSALVGRARAWTPRWAAPTKRCARGSRRRDTHLIWTFGRPARRTHDLIQEGSRWTHRPRPG